jgi:hypothetical protein
MTSANWVSLLIFGRGQGGGVNLWSSFPSCDGGGFLFQSSPWFIRPIYTEASVVKDSNAFMGLLGHGRYDQPLKRPMPRITFMQ